MATFNRAAALDSYQEEGYAVFRGVLDRELVAEAGAHVEWLIRKHPEKRPENLDFALAKDDPFWIRLVSDARLLDVAQEFIGPNIALFATHYISKPAGDGRPVLWHQDGSYWPLDPMEVVTLWLAVDPSMPENGCMQVIPGTQHLDLQQNQSRTDVANVLGSSMDESLVDESKAVDVILEPGDVSVHHPNVIHGSRGNYSAMRRCGLTIRYIPTSTRITKPDVGVHLLLRGKAMAGDDSYLAKPRYRAGEHFPFEGCAQWA